MSERLSDEQVAHIEATCMEWGWPEFVSLAREVQWWRNDDVLGVTAVFDLMNRHDITVEGIVALVDEVMDDAAWKRLHSTRDDLRRLARREEA